MTVLDGEAPSPSIRSIVAGIAAAVLLFLAIFNLPLLVKSLGAVLGFLPSKIGLIQVVQPHEVLTVDISRSPSLVNITKPGDYLLYTNNYDLLVINDAVVEAESKPWLTIEAENEEEIPVHLISRGMAWYDTIHAKGRPVATFHIESPGEYVITHPTRYDTASIVPNYTVGHEKWITFIYLAELAIVIFILWDVRGAVRERRRKAREQANYRLSDN
jgi:hypothetical protein